MKAIKQNFRGFCDVFLCQNIKYSKIKHLTASYKPVKLCFFKINKGTPLQQVILGNSLHVYLNVH